MSVIILSTCTFTEDTSGLTTDATAPTAEVELPALEVEKKPVLGDGKNLKIL